jgi:microcin C transport system permease protein
MGVDAVGRDVFARVLYGMRTALSFGLLLVAWAVLLGCIVGAVQGYFGGWVDIAFQRTIEIWSALPFLYVMILVGAVLGRGFGLLLLCYGLFNWIGVSYYLRAEFLRLRGRPFVDAARCQGLGTARIIFRHVLPNALTPVVTLLPFNLVGAISSLTALDYLGFGLPPLTPSWGELLQQAQAFRRAWWLTVYPSLALFTVMILAVLVGEGMRDAFDPKPRTRYR